MDVRFHLDSNGRDFAIEHVQDCTEIIDWNAQARADQQPSDWGRHRARVPHVILVKWLDEERARGNAGIRLFSPEFNAIVERKLGDPEWFYLRTDRPHLQMGWS